MAIIAQSVCTAAAITTATHVVASADDFSSREGAAMDYKVSTYRLDLCGPVGYGLLAGMFGSAI